MSHASLDDLSAWNEFALAMAGVCAVLAGLVFVALSVNLDRILAGLGLPGRAGETVLVFVAAVLQCALVLLPEQPARQLGRELLILGLLEAASLGAIGWTGVRARTRQPWHWDLARLLGEQASSLPVAVAGVLLLREARSGMYWLAAAVLSSVAVGAANAWVLIVEVVSDERYRPLEDRDGDDRRSAASDTDRVVMQGTSRARS